MSTGDQKPPNDESTSEEEILLPEDSGETPTPESNSPQDGPASESEPAVQPVEGARDFNHPLLKGKSPEEVERLFALQEQAVREQNTELNKLHSRVNSRRDEPTAPTPNQPAQPEDDGYGDDFMAPRLRNLEKRLVTTLDKMVEPLRRSHEATSTQSVRQQLASKFKYFTVLEPHIDSLLRERNFDPATVDEDTLTTLYHTARGIAAERGINLEVSGSSSAPTPAAPPQPNGNTSQEPPMAIPQHRASGAPLPAAAPQKQRELTENERRLAKEYFPDSQDPVKDYLNLQSMPEDEIVSPGFSKEGW